MEQPEHKRAGGVPQRTRRGGPRRKAPRAEQRASPLVWSPSPTDEPPARPLVLRRAAPPLRVPHIGRCLRRARARSRGSLHLVDLAGSERIKKSGATARGSARKAEAVGINSSLLVLGKVRCASRRGNATSFDVGLQQPGRCPGRCHSFIGRPKRSAM